MTSFLEAKSEFDNSFGKRREIDSLVPQDGKHVKSLPIKNIKGELLEEYYKWQFLYALIHSGLYQKEFIGSEVRFPKGSKGAKDLKVDSVIFDDPDWILHYTDYWSHRKPQDLQWLNDHMIAVIEFKRGEKEIEQVFTRQVKPAMREKDPSDQYVLGIYYDAERLFLFHRRNGKYLRYDESKNQKAEDSGVGDLTLRLPDPYSYIPSFAELIALINKPMSVSRANRGIDDLDVITSISTVQIKDALSEVLRTLDKNNLVNQRGYEILIQIFALKIFDEKRNQRSPQKPLEFYLDSNEEHFNRLSEKPIQAFISRMQGIWSVAEVEYQKILRGKAIDWKNTNHIRAVVAVCSAFQDYSFVRSSKSDLYQIIFYNFANSFKRDESAQFLTPLPLIDFLVEIVNPRDGETLIDPCCGIGDFLSLSYVNAQAKAPHWQLSDSNIYGVDLDENMVMLATLNMLLNGDGEAKIFHQPDKGSIFSKIAAGNPPTIVELLPDHNKGGNWDSRPDTTKLMKFDVVLTNPPFGEDRAYRPKNNFDLEVIETYETWDLVGGKSIDLGIVFLENAYRLLQEEGRLGIVLSSSIASIDKWQQIRSWFTERLRVVALFDLPPNVFAETGVNTTLLVAYKAKLNELRRLEEQDYSVFIRNIKRVGYEKRTSKRNVFFNPIYKVDSSSFEVMIDMNGSPILDEEFSEIVSEFKKWALAQEQTLQRLFLNER